MKIYSHECTNEFVDADNSIIIFIRAFVAKIKNLKNHPDSNLSEL